MKCKSCKQDDSNEKLKTDRGHFQIPFKCNTCKSIKINYQPVRDVLLVFPYPAPKSIGGIILVDEKFIGGSAVEHYRENKCVVLAMGPGYFDKKEGKFRPTHTLEVGDVVYFNKKVPWKIDVKNDDGNKFPITLCGFADVWGIQR